MANLLRSSIAARSTAIIVVIVGLLGLGFLALAIPLAEQRETARQQDRLNQLLDTVERTVSIACFLSDKQLADEVARGLIGNRTVRQVIVSVGSERLADRSRADAPGMKAGALPPGTLVRKVVSPFNPDDIVGEIVLVPDEAEIRSTVRQASWFIALLIVVQVAFTGMGVVAVVIRLIARPIARISARLHELRAEAGQKLDIPRGNETDEIGQLVRDVNAMADYLVTILNEERSLHLQREVEERKFRAIFEHADTGIFLLDESGLVISRNQAFGRVFGIPETAPPGTPSPVFAELLGEHGGQARDLIAEAALQNRSVSRDIRLAGKAGAPARWVNLVLSPAEDRRLQGVANDITERKRVEEAAQALATTDRLTGLGNRLGFERRLEQMIDECYRDPGRRFAMLMIDLDWFKQVNDTYGHGAGDLVLAQVARTLEKRVRKSDFVGRLGGDEFIVLLDSTVQREIIERIVADIIGGIGEPVPVGAGVSARVGASVGIALFEGATMPKEELIKQADAAMYEAKQGGRNTYRFYGQRPPPLPGPLPPGERE